MKMTGGKLKRVIKYLNRTRNLKLTLTADNLAIIRWYVDASNAIHNDCNGHIRSMMTIGSGAITSFSRKQKINGESSTEAELIGVDDALPQILWTRYFMESKGYKVKDNILYQDNKSAMLLEQNGKNSTSKRMKHVKVRYFLFKIKLIREKSE